MGRRWKSGRDHYGEPRVRHGREVWIADEVHSLMMAARELDYARAESLLRIVQDPDVRGGAWPLAVSSRRSRGVLHGGPLGPDIDVWTSGSVQDILEDLTRA